MNSLAGPSKSNPAEQPCRIAWITDPHFDHLPAARWQAWADELSKQAPDALVLTGDLSEGDDVAFQLNRLASWFRCPIHFVLGNHDFYDSSIAGTRRRCIDLARDTPSLNYLSDSSPIELFPNVMLVGDDGWGDAVHGDFSGSRVRLNDFQRIEDFQRSDPSRWQSMIRAEGQASADRLESKCLRLPDGVQTVVVATHVPPFRDACWYEGHVTDDHWAPFFVCGAIGDSLLRLSSKFPKRRFIVLCGHTHHDGIATMADNLIVHTGYSAYGEISTESMLAIDSRGVHVPRIPTTGLPVDRQRSDRS